MDNFDVNLYGFREEGLRLEREELVYGYFHAISHSGTTCSHALMSRKCRIDQLCIVTYVTVTVQKLGVIIAILVPFGAPTYRNLSI